MPKVISCKINVSKIDESKLFSGEKGTYLDCALIETPNGKYGDWMIVQSVSKEERERGIKGAILGNGKNQGNPSQMRNATQSAPSQPAGEPGDVPF